MMSYHGFAARDHIILDHIPIGDDLSVLEIGVGTGSTMEYVVDKVKTFYGVDISAEIVEVLNCVYGGNPCIHMVCLDVCSGASLGRTFDVIYSADALEHVEQPQNFFHFIATHLSPDGVAVITFPNESEKKHHGITWFTGKAELLTLIEGAGLNVAQFYEVKKTPWHALIERALWDFPKSLLRKISGGEDAPMPQTFKETRAYQILKGSVIKLKFFSYYARTVTKMAALFTLYRYSEIDEGIQDTILVLRLTRKKD